MGPSSYVSTTGVTGRLSLTRVFSSLRIAECRAGTFARSPRPWRGEERCFLTRLRRVALPDALTVHPVGERIGEVADRHEEGDQEEAGRDPLQRRHVPIEEHHRDDEDRPEDERTLEGTLPRGRLDHALVRATARAGGTVLTRARLGLLAVLLRAQLRG